MGASGWNYFVPYQADLQAAFEQLQAEVLQSGDFRDYLINGRIPLLSLMEKSHGIDECAMAGCRTPHP